MCLGPPGSTLSAPLPRGYTLSARGGGGGHVIQEHGPWAWGRSPPAWAPPMGRVAGGAYGADRARGSDAAPPFGLCSEAVGPWPCSAEWGGSIVRCCRGEGCGSGKGKRSPPPSPPRPCLGYPWGVCGCGRLLLGGGGGQSPRPPPRRRRSGPVSSAAPPPPNSHSGCVSELPAPALRPLAQPPADRSRQPRGPGQSRSRGSVGTATVPPRTPAAQDHQSPRKNSARQIHT